MTTLLIDAGNTRVKWALLRGERMGSQRAAAHAGWTARDFERRVFAGRGIDRVIVASVAGARIDGILARAARRIAGVEAEFMRSARRLAGVRTQYGEPWRLGVDRLVAAVGAHRIAGRRGACIVDVGTAMTLDLVDGDGVHHGGAIVPGPELMISSLLHNTDGIGLRARGGQGGRSLFARSTRAAIEQGARLATAAAIDRAVGESKAVLGGRPVAILTGGALSQVLPLIRTRDARIVPDLVLRGLAVIAATASLE